MMGNDILPSDEKRCTYTSTKICSGDDTAIVKFFSPSEFNENFVRRLRKMHIEKSEIDNYYSFETLKLSDYQNLFNKLDKEYKELYEKTANKDVEDCLKNKETINNYLGHAQLPFKGEQLVSEEFKNFIKTPAYALAVKEIIINSSQLVNMPNAVIYDVPGFNSPTQIHKDQTIEFMDKADAIVLIASAYEPSFTDSYDLFNKADSNGIDFSDKLFVFANKADYAKNLSENISTIKNDLASHKMMSPNYFDQRIITGSAASFLVKSNKLKIKITDKNGLLDEERSRIEENNLRKFADDGIDKIKEILENYNQTERFEILKRRINQKQNEIYDVFSELFKDNDVDPSADYSQIRTDLTIEVASKSVSIIKKLDAYREKLIKDYNAEKTISQEVKEKVDSDICRDKFSVSQDELDEAKNKYTDTDGVVNLTGMDVYIRGNKSKKIYKEFANIIVELAKNHHNNAINNIKDIFRTELQIQQGADGEKVIDNILTNQDINVSSDGGYYKPLIERFAKDLFEILMETSFTSMDRWQRFEKGFANFSSLAMFDERKAKTNSGNNQPLYFALLFQQRDRYEKNSVINNVLNVIQTTLKFVPTPPIIKLVENAVFSGKKSDVIETAVKSLVGTFTRPNTNLTQEQKETNIITKLKGLAVSNTVTEDYISEASYDKFFQGKRSKNLEIIPKEINEDIDILHDALCNVVVNAINIEKAFLAFEDGNFQNLLAFLNDRKAWPKFVSDNLRLITPGQYKDLETEVQRQMSRQSILKDIKNTLDQMNSNSQTQNQ